MECIYDFLFDWIAYHHFVIIPGMMVHMQCSYLCIGIIQYETSSFFSIPTVTVIAHIAIYTKKSMHRQWIRQVSGYSIKSWWEHRCYVKKKNNTHFNDNFFPYFFCIDIGFIYSKKKKKYLVFSTIKDIQCLMIKIRTINILVIEVSVFFHVSLYN